MGSQLRELPNFVLSSNISNIEITQSLITVKNINNFEEGASIIKFSYKFSLLGVTAEVGN